MQHWHNDKESQNKKTTDCQCQNCFGLRQFCDMQMLLQCPLSYWALQHEGVEDVLSC